MSLSTKKLKYKLLGSFAAIIALLLVFCLVLNSNIEDKELHARVVNLSGQLRALSHQLTEEALLLKTTNYKNESDQRKLKNTFGYFLVGQELMSKGSKQYSILSPMDNSTKFEYQRLSKISDKMSVEIDCLTSSNCTSKENSLQRLQFLTKDYFEVANDIIHRNESLAKKDIKFLKGLQLAVFSFLILFIFAQLLIVILPTYRELSNQVTVLKAKESELKRIERIAQIGTWSFNLTTQEILWTDQMYEIFPEDRHKGPPSFERHKSTIHPEDLEHWEQTVSKCIETGNSYTMTFRVIHDNENYVAVRAHGQALKDPQGKVTQLFGTCQDVTEEYKLEKENNILRTITDNMQSTAHIGGWELDLTTQQTTWTDEVYNIYSLPRDTLVSKLDSISFYAEHERPRITKYVENCIAQKKPFDDVFEFRDSKGNHKWVRANGTPILNRQGKVVKLRGLLQDITEVKIQEIELYDSKKYLQLAVEGAEIGIWDWYLNDNSVKFSPAWTTMLGLDHSKVEMQLSTWESRVHPDDLENCYKDIRAYMNGETEYYENVHRMKHAKGHWVYILDRGKFSEWDERGNPTRFTGTHLDISATSKMQEQQKFILSSLKMGTWHWDIIKDELTWDDAMFEVFGAEKSKFSRAYDAWNSSLHPEDAKETMAKVNKAIDEPDSGDFHHSFRIITPEGDIRFILGLGKVVRDSDRNAIEMFGINQDVSNEYELKKEVEEQKQMALHNAKLASLGELAGGVAHEINNPLAIATGYVEVLERKSKDCSDLDLKGNIEKCVSKITNALNRVSSIVNGLRVFARINENTSKQFLLLPAIEDTISLVSEFYRSKGIQLDFKNLSKSSMVIDGNKGQIQQILMNLISNAKDATEGKETRQVEIVLNSDKNFASLSVSDNGKGIAKEHQDKIFNPFFTTKEVGQGTGIGLSIVYSIVQEHKGQISFQSHPDRGTTFTLRLPLSEQMSAAA